MRTQEQEAAQVEGIDFVKARDLGVIEAQESRFPESVLAKIDHARGTYMLFTRLHDLSDLISVLSPRLS